MHSAPSELHVFVVARAINIALLLERSLRAGAMEPQNENWNTRNHPVAILD